MLALANGVHPKAVQERLGHASIGVTLNICSHVTDGLRTDAAERVAAAISGELAPLVSKTFSSWPFGNDTGQQLRALWCVRRGT